MKVENKFVRGSSPRKERNKQKDCVRKIFRKGKKIPFYHCKS